MNTENLPEGPGAGRNYETNRGYSADREQAVQYHDLLATPRRSRIMDVLDERGAVSLTALADILAEDEAGPGYKTADRKRVYVGIYQTHLPRMDSAGVVEFDDDRGIVLTGDRFAELRAFQERARGSHDPGLLARAAARLREVVGRE